MVIDRVQGLFVGADEAQPTESQLGSWRCYNLIWCDSSLKIDKLLYTVDPPPPPHNNINTAHRGRFQVNVNPIGDSK